MEKVLHSMYHMVAGNHVYMRTLVLCWCAMIQVLPLAAQSGYAVPAVKVAEISRLELINLPEHMVHRIKSLTPAQIVHFREEFQETVDQNGESIIVTVQLRFLNDHIVGFVKTAPLTQSSQVAVSNVQIKVPLQWGCIPGAGHSQQHVAYTMKEIKEFNAKEHCEGWHQMKEGEKLLPPVVKKKKKFRLF